MTIDLVDDLHQAEDALAALAADVEAYCSTTNPGPRNQLRNAIKEARDYCRGGCGANGEAFQTECDDDTCGCPCGHVDKWDALPERDRRQYRLREEYLDSGHGSGHLDGCKYGDRYLLIEENVRGGYWLTTWALPEDALVYHREQEYAHEWTASAELLDLDDNTALDVEESRMTRKWQRRPS